MALIVQVSSRNTIIVFSTSTIQYLSCNEVLVLLVFMMSQSSRHSSFEVQVVESPSHTKKQALLSATLPLQ